MDYPASISFAREMSNTTPKKKSQPQIENMVQCSVCGVEMHPEKTGVIRRFFDYVSGGAEVTTSWRCDDCGKRMTITEK